MLNNLATRRILRSLIIGLVTASAALLASCQHPTSGVSDPDNKQDVKPSSETANITPDKPLAKVTAYQHGAGQIRFDVISTGCTQKRDFELVLKPQDDVIELSLFRLHPDRCRRMPFSKSINFALPSGPKHSFQILNPLSKAPSRISLQPRTKD